MRSIDIKGLAVFDIASGCEIGKVSELLINAEKKSVQYLVVDVPNWYFGAHVIPFALTEGIGKDAVMIESAIIMKKLNEEPGAIKLVESGVSLIGCKTLTKKGKFIGRISEIYIDENTGLITGCELIDNITVKGIIPAKSALTFGKDALIVDEKVEDHLLSTIDDVETETVYHTPEPDKAAPPVETMIDESAPVESEPVPVVPAPESDQVADKPKAVQLYEQKQREYLLGREVKDDVYDDNGTLIIKKGEKITQELLDNMTSTAKLKYLLLHV